MTANNKVSTVLASNRESFWVWVGLFGPKLFANIILLGKYIEATHVQLWHSIASISHIFRGASYCRGGWTQHEVNVWVHYRHVTLYALFVVVAGSFNASNPCIYLLGAKLKRKWIMWNYVLAVKETYSNRLSGFATERARFLWLPDVLEEGG